MSALSPAAVDMVRRVGRMGVDAEGLIGPAHRAALDLARAYGPLGTLGDRLRTVLDFTVAGASRAES